MLYEVITHLAMKREVFVASAALLALFLLAVFNLPPASWIIELNGWVKAAWVGSPELEPPFGHAEEVSLAGLARRMDLDLPRALEALRENHIRFDSERDSLERIARGNGTTPMALYGIIRGVDRPSAGAAESLSPEAIEAKYAGTGLGRKRLDEVCRSVGIDPARGLERLAAEGIPAEGGETAREVADRHDLSPMDLLKIMTRP